LGGASGDASLTLFEPFAFGKLPTRAHESDNRSAVKQTRVCCVKSAIFNP
jgi:hypothetical protein